MCIRVSARTTLVLVAFSTENFVLPFCRTKFPESITPSSRGVLMVMVSSKP